MNLYVFEFITEDQYNDLKHVLGQTLPSMEISTIKHDKKWESRPRQIQVSIPWEPSALWLESKKCT